MVPYVLQNLDYAGRTKLQLQRISLCDVRIPEPETKIIRDTVASCRLDSVISAGFRMSRARAAEQICSGAVAIDGLPCESRTGRWKPVVSFRSEVWGKFGCCRCWGRPERGGCRWKLSNICDRGGEAGMMEDVIARINELARKAKTVGLTPAEISERDGLRRIYLDAVRENLTAQLEHTYLVDEKGNKRKLPKKKRE